MTKHIQIAGAFEGESVLKQPILSPSEVEIAITSGIASPCGQAMISTVEVLTRACSPSPESRRYLKVIASDTTANPLGRRKHPYRWTRGLEAPTGPGA